VGQADAKLVAVSAELLQIQPAGPPNQLIHSPLDVQI